MSMAARSPIVLDSSPRLPPPPSITPQSTRRRSSVPGSSSSALPSPSTFVRPPSKSLTSGSRAQQIPKDVPAGFASAASLLRDHRLESATEAAKDGGCSIKPKAGMDKAERPKKAAGKLSRPSKTKPLKATTRDETLPLRSPLQDFAYHDYTVQKDRQDAPALESSSIIKDGNKQKYRQPRMSLSEYDLPSEKDEAPVSRPEVATKKVKKPQSKPAPPKKTRKRAAAQEDGTESAKPKRPRKKLAKSESIILNSDEPDPLPVPNQKTGERALPALGHAGTSIAEHPNVQEPPAAALDEEAIQTSMYFTNREPTMHDRDVVDENEPRSPLRNVHPPEIVHISPERRMSATPGDISTTTDKCRPKTPGPEQLADFDKPKISFTDIVNGLGYSNQEARASPERTIAGNTLTKRRRIELADAATLPLAQQVAPKLAPAEKPKKVKAPKKKPQTITDLATKAYRSVDAETGDSTVSAFFAAQPAEVAPKSGNDGSGEAVKVKKPRKPRAKKTDGDARASKPLRPAKPKRTKAGETALVAKLFSPGAARAEENRQDFVFGTSSQLAVEDSPRFIRQMQTALLASEMPPPVTSDGSPSRKSCIRVHSAPEGTNLSVGQAFQDHWCVASRNASGDLIPVDSGHEDRSNRRQLRTVDVSIQTPDTTNVATEPSSLEDSTIDTTMLEEKLKQTKAPTGDEDGTREVVDLCNTSPAAPTNAEAGTALDKSCLEPSGDQRAEIPAPIVPATEDTWMLLSSDDPPQEIAAHGPIAPTGGTLLTNPTKRVPLLSRSATSPSLGRHVLQALDANASLMARTSPIRGTKSIQQRPSSTSASLFSESKELHDSLQAAQRAPIDIPAVAKKRGRPPGKKAQSLVSPKSRRPKATISASQPTASAEYMNIDEISDSDSPTTPSPPRRRANSTPPAIKPLELETIVSPLSKAKAIAGLASNVNIKATDDSWPALMADLFPRISATVKSTSPSTDMARPTWHEKILLYDPIILEDFTTWLNNQGLGLEVQRLRAKPKQKGRKKKDAPPDVPEYETVKEELKPWMVQRWCEDRSVCCLWKEGVNGVRRNRY